MLHGSFSSVFTAVVLGGALGFVMQRGRFCLNSAFRDVIFIKDYTMFRAYLLAVVVAIIGSNFLEQMVVYSLLRQNFVPVANIAGGFLFGIVMTQSGMISPTHKFLSSLKMSVGGTTNPAIWNLFGNGPLAKWLTIGVFCTAALVFVFKGKPTFGKSGKGYSWGLTGFPEFSFFGIFNGTWGVFFGSILMGIGAVIAGGCNLGHGVTGMSTMAISSLVAICSIILGNWTMVYFKFINTTADLHAGSLAKRPKPPSSPFRKGGKRGVDSRGNHSPSERTQ